MKKNSLNQKISGFTLAEVLITLGIIGVVAALTMPSLIAHHRKKVIETGLEKYSSIMQQATIRIKLDFGDTDTELNKIAEYIDKDDPDDAENLINQYYKPYIEMISVEKGQSGAFAYLKDGSAFYLRRLYDHDTTTNLSGTYIFFCPKANTCKELKEDEESLKEAVGKKIFIFYSDGTVNWALNNFSRDELLQKCEAQAKASNEYCTALIIMDGWKISKDYPFRI